MSASPKDFATETLAAQLAASSLDMVAVADAAQRIVEFNSPAEKIFGHGRAEIIGKSLDTLFAEPALHARVREMLADKGVYLGEILTRRKNGDLFVSLLSASAVRDHDGRIVSEVCVFRDVTRERQSEEMHHRYLLALGEIANDPRLTAGSLELAFQCITEWATLTLGVGRASVWLFDARHEQLQCHDLYEPASERHSAGDVIACGDHPAYFAALQRRETIAAEDVRTDLRTSTFTAPGGKANTISMLDAPIMASPDLIGVIRHEVTGIVRHWSLSDQFFAKSLANLAALAVRNYEHLQADLSQALAVRASESRKTAILESALDGLITMDHEGRILEFNPAAERIFGYKRADVLGEKLAEKIIPPSMRSSHAKGLAEHLKTGRGQVLGQRIETMGMRADGSVFPVELSIVRIGETQPPVFTGFIRDITERRESERRILEREEELRRNFALAPAGITLLDLNGCLLDVNPAFLSMTGYSREELTLRPFAELVFPADRTLWQTAWTNLSANAAHETMELRCVSKSSDTLNLSITAGPICDSSGGLLRVMAMHTDITERKRLESELVQTRKLKALGEIAGGVAHEFNNLLSPVLIQMSVIAKMYPQDKQLHGLLEPVKASVEQAADLCRRALAIGRKASDTVLPLNFSKEVRNTIGLLAKTIDRRIAVDLDLDEDTSPIMASPSQISQIVMNLGLNARDALAERLEKSGSMQPDWSPKLRIEGRHVEAARPGVHPTQPMMCQRLRVEDNASGIPPEVLEHIFEPFFTTKAAKGTGLGLPTVWSVTDGLGGWLTVESTPMIGTRFEVHLPCTGRQRDQAQIKPTAAPANGQGRKRRVLLVEDSPILAKTSAGLLRSAGHEVTVAADGLEGWEIFSAKRDQFDVILMDVNMPRMSGVDLLARIRETDYAGCILFTTGYMSEEQMSALRRHGIVHVLAKPVLAEELLESVAQGLDSRRTEHPG